MIALFQFVKCSQRWLFCVIFILQLNQLWCLQKISNDLQFVEIEKLDFDRFFVFIDLIIIVVKLNVDNILIDTFSIWFWSLTSFLRFGLAIIELSRRESTFFVEDWNSLNDEKDLSFSSLDILICEVNFILNFLNRCKIKKNTNSLLSFNEDLYFFLLANFTNHQYY